MKKSLSILPAVLLFMQAVQQDAALAAKVSQADSFDQIVEIAEKEGYKFTSDNLEAGIAEFNGKKSLEDKMSDAELESVATGNSFEVAAQTWQTKRTKTCGCR